MSQANVYSGNINNAVWYTDKAEIVTGTSPASYNIYNANVQSILIGGYIATGNTQIQTTLFTTANLVGATISNTTAGIANTSYTVSSVTVAANSAITSITMNYVATANTGNATSFAQFTLGLAPVGNLYSSNPQVAQNSRQQIYVGAGNYLTLTSTGNNSTVRELGTASSANAGF